MLSTPWRPVFPLLGVAVLAISACGTDASAADDEPEPATSATTTATDEVEDTTTSVEDSNDPTEKAPELSGEMTGEIITADGDNIHGSMPVELWPVCDDPEALAANEGHDPAGWPQDWDGKGAMPELECHPDYIEMLEWDQFDSFMACWEGIQTSAFYSTDQFRTEADLREALWDQSRERAEWPGYEGTCDEQVAQHEAAGGYDQDW